MKEPSVDPLTRRLSIGKLRFGLLALAAAAALGLAGCTTATQPQGWSGPEISGQTIWTGTTEGQMVAVDAPTQAVVHRFPPANSEDEAFRLNGIYAQPTIEDNALYFGAYNARLFGLDTQTAQPRWQFAANESIIGGVLPYQSLLYFGTSAGTFYGFDPATQQVRCQFQAGKAIWSTPVEANGTIYLTSLDQRVYALDPATCQPRPSFSDDGAFEANAAIGSTPVVDNGVIYFGAMDKRFYAVDAQTGEQRWVFTGADNWFWTKAAVHQGTVYAGSLDYNFYALDAATGAERWRFATGQQIHSWPVVVGNLVIFGSYDKKVYALDLQTGAKGWEYPAGAAILSPLAAANGTVYVNTWLDDRLHAVDAATGTGRWVVSLKK